MRKNRDERFASAMELSSALDQQMASASTELYTAPTMVKPIPAAPRTVIEKPRKSRSWIWAVIAAIVVLGAAFAVMRAKQQQQHAATQPAPVPVQKPPVVTATQAPSQTTVSVIEEKPAPERAPEPVHEAAPPPIVAAPPPPPDAHAHYRNGLDALLNHDFGQSAHELQLALDHPDDLSDRERRLAEMSLAIATNDRMRAGELGREFHKIYPDDPDFQRIKHEFEPPPRPPFQRRRRWGQP
jgi:hypothetical protein